MGWSGLGPTLSDRKLQDVRDQGGYSRIRKGKVGSLFVFLFPHTAAWLHEEIKSLDRVSGGCIFGRDA